MFYKPDWHWCSYFKSHVEGDHESVVTRMADVTNLEDLVGERLMIGLPRATLDAADIGLFRDTRAASLILYRRNFESPAQLLDLLGRLESALGRRLLVATDHEGGRIVMLGRGVTIFPDNLAVGTAGEETFAYKQGLIEARELRRLGPRFRPTPSRRSSRAPMN